MTPWPCLGPIGAIHVGSSGGHRLNYEGGLRYFIMVVKCASHQANLTVASAVNGRAACVGAEGASPTTTSSGEAWFARAKSAKSFAGRQVCGAIVRLTKYLISDYHAEFAANIRDWVSAFAACGRSLEREGQSRSA